MSDIFREVDDDLRQERLQQLWKQYGTYFVGGAVALVLAIGGYKFYRNYEVTSAGQAGDQFAQATQLIAQSKFQEAEPILAELAKDGYANYPVLARLQQAAALAAQKQREPAVEIYDLIANDTGADLMFRDLARLRAAIILVDSASPEEIARRLETLMTENSVWHHTARELVALSAYRARDYKAADDQFAVILSDTGAPAQLRARAEMMRALIAPKLPATSKVEK
ncbi:MAG: tetratricopeptide repeat protein [Alphaproteobacteria bacterium]